MGKVRARMKRSATVFSIAVSFRKNEDLGQYRKQKLIERYGADMRLPDLREEIAKCRRHGQMDDACMVRYLDLLPRVSFD
jgi:hypothetical protein